MFRLALLNFFLKTRSLELGKLFPMVRGLAFLVALAQNCSYGAREVKKVELQELQDRIVQLQKVSDEGWASYEKMRIIAAELSIRLAELGENPATEHKDGACSCRVCR